MGVIRRALGGVVRRVFFNLLLRIWHCWRATTKQRGRIRLRQQCGKALWSENLRDVCHSAEAVEHDPILPWVRVQEHRSTEEKQSQLTKGTNTVCVWAVIISSDKTYLADAHKCPSSWLYCWSKWSSTCWHEVLSFLRPFITWYKVKMLSRDKS